MVTQFCMIPVYNYWVTYARVKSMYGDYVSDVTPSTALCYSQVKATSVILIAIIFFLYFMSCVQSLSRVVTISELTCVAGAILASLFLLFNGSVRRTHTPRNVISIEFINFLIFCVIGAMLLIFSASMLTTFFTLELLGSVTLYAFFVFSGYSISGAAQQASSASTSSIYQFILNFFGSVVFYVGLGFLTYYHGSSTFWNASTRMAGGYALWAQTTVAAAILIKLGLGPWIFYKLSIYKGLTVQTIAVYTFVYFGALLIFTLNVLHYTGFSVASWFSGAACVFFTICAVIFGANVFQTGSIMLFLSFSSLLNLVFIALQTL